MLFKGGIKWRCPRCGHYQCFKLVYHVIVDNTVVYSENKDLNDGLKEVVKNG